MKHRKHQPEGGVYVSPHAVERYQERFDSPSATWRSILGHIGRHGYIVERKLVARYAPRMALKTRGNKKTWQRHYIVAGSAVFPVSRRRGYIGTAIRLKDDDAWSLQVDALLRALGFPLAHIPTPENVS